MSTHTNSKYCIIVLYCIYILLFKSRRNATFWSKVGKTGVGEQGITRQYVSNKGMPAVYKHASTIHMHCCAEGLALSAFHMCKDGDVGDHQRLFYQSVIEEWSGQ